MGETKKTTLDKYSGYFTVFPCNFKNGETPQKDKPFLYISEKCPEDIKAELLKDWENDTVLFYCAKTLVSPRIIYIGQIDNIFLSGQQI